MDGLTVFWAIISIIFLTLIVIHSVLSGHKFIPLKYKGKVASINRFPLGIKEFVADINHFINNLVKNN